MDENQIVDNLKEFIMKSFPKARQSGLDVEDRLIEKGIIDSLGLLTLIDYLEMTFEIKVSDLDVTEDKFGSIQALSKFIHDMSAKEPD